MSKPHFNGFDPIEGGLRDRVREFIHAMIEGEFDMALAVADFIRACGSSATASGGGLRYIESRFSGEGDCYSGDTS